MTDDTRKYITATAEDALNAIGCIVAKAQSEIAAAKVPKGASGVPEPVFQPMDGDEPPPPVILPPD